MPSPFAAVRYSLAATQLSPHLGTTATCDRGAGSRMHSNDRQSSIDLAELFTGTAAEHERCFWLDGSASRPWSGSGSIVGWLTEDDVSLTYYAQRRQDDAMRQGIDRRW